MTFRVCLDIAYLLKIENLLLKTLYQNNFLKAKHCSKTHGYVFQFLVVREQYLWNLL